MKNKNILQFAMLIWIAAGPLALAQQVFDARGVGMAFSNSADTRGLEQVGMNPATLALKHPFNFELNILSANVGVYNNSLSKGLYDQYFTTGAVLTSTDKRSILQAIPASGLRGQAALRANTFAVYMPKFSLALTGMGDGFFNLPREIFELGLYGNDESGRVYDFSTADASGWGGAAISLGLGFPVRFLRGGMFDFAAIGMTSKYIIGLQYAEVERAEGQFHNLSQTNSLIRFQGVMDARRATRGSGFGFDVGLVLQSRQKLNVSIAMLNALGNVNWNGGTERTIYSVRSESFAISSDGVEDSVVVSEDSTYAIDPFRTRLPAVLDVGVAYRFTRHLLFSAEVEQRLNHSMGTVKSSRIAIGTEFTAIPLLPLRGGISLGGPRGFSTALGLGLNLKYWFVDLGIVNHGGFSSGKAKGLTLAATSRFRF